MPQNDQDKTKAQLIRELTQLRKALHATADALVIAAAEAKLATMDEGQHSLKPLAKEVRDQRAGLGECLLCQKPARSRGLCTTCLRDVKRQIDAGRFAELDFVSSNLMLPLQPPGRKRVSGLKSHITEPTGVAEEAQELAEKAMRLANEAKQADEPEHLGQ